ncbi:host attachment family protein [Roseivivax isoporae]|uniref:Host attachment protein n=1 Tax=Roseivivax isoporae LMG 25204 TaxID=1449351 RepID=X7FBV2_9RHOB|nr:host attachment family protein [Roseivivax isoporae]ETX29556.1 Host attachment protein [Roseivivax isoporae LMG 25204]
MEKLTNGTWVLIADGEKALFLRNDLDGDIPVLNVVREEAQDNPKDIDQSANKPGRMQDTGVGQRSAMDDTDWHQLAKERFADDLADILYKQAHKHKFERIVLVAAPQVLGELRNKMHKEVASKVVAEVPKTLTNHPLDKVAEVIRNDLAAA